MQEGLRFAFLDPIMVIISGLGNGGFLWLLVCAGLLLSKKYRRWGVLLLCSMAVTFVTGELILKNIICRPRPCMVNEAMPLLIPRPLSYSFPSGHSASSFCAAVVLWRMNRRAGAAAFVLAAAIAFSRMYLYVHFPTDVAAGSLLGIGGALLTVFFFSRHEKKKDLAQ